MFSKKSLNLYYHATLSDRTIFKTSRFPLALISNHQLLKNIRTEIIVCFELFSVYFLPDFVDFELIDDLLWQIPPEILLNDDSSLLAAPFNGFC